MSVLFTESFMRYNRRALSASERNNDLEAGGYPLRSYVSGITSPPTTPTNIYPKWRIDADPVYAARNVAVSEVQSANSSARATSLPFYFESATSHYIFGARVRLQSSGTLASVNAMILTVGPANIAKNTSGSTNNQAFARPSTSWSSLFAMDIVDGSVVTGVSNTLENVPYTYVAGKDIYVEVEVDTVANLVRVWVDDLLVVDSVFAAGILASAKAAYDQGIGIMASQSSSLTSNSVEVMVRDVYCLAVDAVAPFQRLGPTTQVIGERPTDDAQAEFTRPAGYDSNAQVAALGVVANPSDYLTADQVDQEDRYTVADSTVSTAASQVYAVGIKTQVSNFAASAHAIGAVIRTDTGGGGATSETVSLGSIDPGSGFLNKAAYFTQDPDTGAAWTPTGAAAAEFGLKVLS